MKLQIDIRSKEFKAHLEALRARIDRTAGESFFATFDTFVGRLHQEVRSAGLSEDIWSISLRHRRRGLNGLAIPSKPFALIHNRGGVIRPRHARRLAIPLVDGASRPSEDQTPMRAWTSRAGHLILWDVGRKPAEPRYLLRDNVQLQGTDYLEVSIQTLKREASTGIEAALKAALDQAGQ